MLPLRHSLRVGAVSSLARTRFQPRLLASALVVLRVAIPAPRLIGLRFESTATSENPDGSNEVRQIPERKHASVYIANVFPVMLGAWDVRPQLARLREETLMEELMDIMAELKGLHAFNVESYEIARKDGGVFCHFSYLPPLADDLPKNRTEKAIHTPEDFVPDPTSPASLFLPAFIEAAKKHGGWPSWLGAWWSSWMARQNTNMRTTDEAGHHLYRGDATPSERANTSNAPLLQGWQRVAGAGRCWMVRGRQWTEDLNRFPSSRLRIEFDGPDVSQEMMYRLFRPYGRLTEIAPPTPVASGALRYAILSFSRMSTAISANNCMHGFESPVKTADYDLQESPEAKHHDIPLSRLRIYYERPLKAHVIRSWISDHPRLALPVIAFLLATLSYTFFDPIRSFFVRSEIEGVWDLDKYKAVKFVRDNIIEPIAKVLAPQSHRRRRDASDLGRASWRDRLEAEKSIERWLSEYPSTFIVVTGPPGSGKQDLIDRVIKQEKKPSLIIDCAEIGKSKTDRALVGNLAEQTGYWPTFSFLQSMNGLIDLASVGLIGQKAGFSTPIDEQLRSMLDVVSTALKDTAEHFRDERKKAKQCSENDITMAAEEAHELELVRLGVWHDGRLDCIAGNGIMSELGLGIEEPTIYDMPATAAPLMGNNAPIDGEGVPPGGNLDVFDGVTKAVSESARMENLQGDDDVESSLIQTLPIVVLRNFAIKPARGDLWSVMAEWAAGLVENKLAHVIVIGEGSSTIKPLTTALPSKPLNSVALSDADDYNSLEFVHEKLSTTDQPYELTDVDRKNIAKLGGRMVDLELLVYKVRSGQTIPQAVDDIVLRNVVELRKAAFGDDAEDAKHLPWTRAQAWKIVSELAKKPEASYAKLLQDFPFKGSEPSLKALEAHDLVFVQSVDGRPSKIKPGKPVFRQAFASLVDDDVFRAQCQIEYNAAVTAKVESEIEKIEAELAKLREITSDGDKLGAGGGGWLGLTKGSAVHQRAQYLLSKLDECMAKLKNVESDTDEQKKVFASGKM